VEPLVPNTPAQNRGTKRSGGMITEKIRAMRTGTKLPAVLWPEISKAAVYLHNQIPRYSYNWRTPYNRFHTYLAHRDSIVVKTRKPDQTHLRAYGCKAFALTPNAQKGVYNKPKDLPRWNPKLKPRAWIGYLISYNSSNIYRIWNPITNRVISTRDMVFNEKEIFNRDIQALKDDYLHLQLNKLSQLLSTIQLHEPKVPRSTILEEEAINSLILNTNTEQKEEVEEVEKEVQFPYTYSRFKPYPTPSLSPPAALLAATIQQAHQLPENQLPENQNMDFEPWIAAFATGRLLQPVNSHNGKTITKAMVQRLTRRPNGLQTLHGQDLPPPPKWHH